MWDGRWISVLSCAAVGWLCAAAGSSRALPTGGVGDLLAASGDDAPCPLAVDLGRLPAEADQIVLVNGAAALRTTPLGPGALQGLEQLGVRGQIDTAWQVLSAQLGWSREEAFDRLLGRRVIYLESSAGGEGGEVRWALLSLVTPETERRLKLRLRVAARGLVHGTQILSVENGRYELAALRDTLGSRGDVTLVLGPAGGADRGSSALFDRVLSCLSGEGPSRESAPAESRGLMTSLAPVGQKTAKSTDTRVRTMGEQAELGSTGAIDALESWKGAADRSSELLVLRSIPARAAPADAAQPVSRRGAGDWSGWTAVSARRSVADGRAWTVRIRVRDPESIEVLTSVELSGDEAWRAWSRGTLASVMRLSPTPGRIEESLPRIMRIPELPVPERAESLLAAGQAFRVFVQGAGVESSVGAEAGRSAPVVSIARQTHDRRRLAPVADGAVTRFFEQVERRSLRHAGEAADVPLSGDGFGGLAPGATRVLPLEMPDTGLLGVVLNRPLTVCWGYPGIARGEDEPADGGDAGWWVVTVAPRPTQQSAECDDRSPAELHRAAVAALSHFGDDVPGRGGAGQSRRRWLWMLSARPADIERSVGDSIPDLGGWRGWLGLLESVEARFSATDGGDLDGEIHVILTGV